MPKTRCVGKFHAAAVHPLPAMTAETYHAAGADACKLVRLLLRYGARQTTAAATQVDFIDIPRAAELATDSQRSAAWRRNC